MAVGKKESLSSHIWINTRDSAKDRGIELTLTKAQVRALAAMDCSYCGSPPQYRKGAKSYAGGAWNGIDRINNDKGYVPGNVLPCCKTCNWAKARLTLKEFLEWAGRLAKATPGSVKAEYVKVSEVLANPPPDPFFVPATSARPIMDDLGNRFESIKAAAKFYGARASAVSRAVNSGSKYKGHMFTAVINGSNEETTQRPLAVPQTAPNPSTSRGPVVDEAGNQWPTIKAVAVHYGVRTNTVTAIVEGRKKSWNGHTFKLVEPD